MIETHQPPTDRIEAPVDNQITRHQPARHRLMIRQDLENPVFTREYYAVCLPFEYDFLRTDQLDIEHTRDSYVNIINI